MNIVISPRVRNALLGLGVLAIAVADVGIVAMFSS